MGVTSTTEIDADELLDDMRDPHLSMCSPATRGIWFDLLCVLHDLGRSGQVTCALDSFCRACRCTPAEFVAAIAELRTTQVAEIHERDGNVTVIGRRAQIKLRQRVLGAERVRRHRCNAPVTPEKRECNADVTTEENADAYINNISLEESNTQEEKNHVGNAKPKAKRATRPKALPDERSKHPAIVAIKAVMDRYPNKQLWDRLILFLGDAPDTEKIRACYLAWLERGYNPMNLSWLFQWTITGIPEKGGFRKENNGHVHTAEAGSQPTTEQLGIRTPRQLTGP